MRGTPCGSQYFIDGSVVLSNLASGPVGVRSDIVFASAHGWYGISGSLPLFLPPISDKLRLCPIPPRLGSADQSPERSGILVGVPAVCAFVEPAGALV